MLPLLAIGAGLGLVKALTLDKAKAERERHLAAATARLSPWTGLKPGAVSEADPLGSGLSFGLVGQGIQNGLTQEALNQKIADKYLQGGGGQVSLANPWANAGGAGPIDYQRMYQQGWMNPVGGGYTSG